MNEGVYMNDDIGHLRNRIFFTPDGKRHNEEGREEGRKGGREGGREEGQKENLFPAMN